MELPSFLSLLFTFLLLLFIFVKKGKTFKPRDPNSKLPPGPWKLPIIGSVHHLLGLPHHSLRNLAKKHGPLMHLQLGEVSTIVISSPKMAKEVMKTHDLMFSNRHMAFIIGITTYGYKDIVFTPYGEYWRQMRKICTFELFSAKRVQSFQLLKEEEASNLIRSISSPDGLLVNFTERIFSSTNDIIARVAFGKKCKDKEAFISSIQEAIKVSTGFSVVDLFPSFEFLRVISGMKAKAERIHQKLDRIAEDIINEHKGNRRTNMPKKDEEDLIDVLLRLQENNDLGFPITNENIKAIILDIFTAGSETSATVTEWVMSEMLRNPRVMEKAQAEVRRVFRGKKIMKEADIHELSYLKAVIKETLRLHPPLPLLLPRECRERCEIDEYEIPIKTKVIINAWAIGRDPDYWTDPERFEPERFDVLSVDYKGANYEYIPFGAGRRICPGILLGASNVELPLAQLLYHFDWKLPNGAKPEELDMTEEFGTTVQRKNNLYVTAIPYCPSPAELYIPKTGCSDTS